MFVRYKRMQSKKNFIHWFALNVTENFHKEFISWWMLDEAAYDAEMELLDLESKEE